MTCTSVTTLPKRRGRSACGQQVIENGSDALVPNSFLLILVRHLLLLVRHLFLIASC